MSILDERELTAEERAAVADEPRPGMWTGDHAGVCADGRALDQQMTDRLIACEIVDRHGANEGADEIRAVAGDHGVVTFRNVAIGFHDVGYAQRGGIHSDPLVRLLAYRTWGERDRRWARAR